MAISDRIAVMDRGAIVQDGTAEDLYRRPASEFVAAFIGRTNLLSGKVGSVSADGVEVEVAGHRLRVRAGHAPLQEGQTIRLVIRPEAIDLEAAAGGGLAGEIVSLTFLGEKVEYQVRVGAEVLQVTGYDPIRRGVFAPGQRIALRISAEGIQLLSAGRGGA